MEKTKGKYKILILATITILAAFLRMYGLNWGEPLYLNPDEKYIVQRAVDMNITHTLSISEYNRPDHFEIRCLSIIYPIVAKLGYGSTVEELFKVNPFLFYIIGRIYIAFWGILMVPLGYCVAEKIRKGSGLLAAFLFATSNLYIEHSHNVAPDVVLSFFVLLAVYMAILYLQTYKRRYLCFLCLAAAVSITIKYPGVLICFLIAYCVIYGAVEKKRYKDIFIWGSLSILLVIGFTVLLSPDLLIHFDLAWKGLMINKNFNNLAGNGAGFFDNLFFYCREVVICSIGWELALFVLIGAVNVVLYKKKVTPVFFPLVFVVVLCVFSLRWVRWGIPLLSTPILLATEGLYCAKEFCLSKAEENKRKGTIIKTIYMVIITYILCNSLINGVYSSIAKGGVEDTQNCAYEWFVEHGISTDNTLADWYTEVPGDARREWYVYTKFSIMDDGKVVPLEEKEYVCISSLIYERFPGVKGYEDAEHIYSYIQENYKLVEKWEVALEADNEKDLWLGNNIIKLVNILSGKEAIGPNIYLYEINAM